MAEQQIQLPAQQCHLRKISELRTKQNDKKPKKRFINFFPNVSHCKLICC